MKARCLDFKEKLKKSRPMLKWEAMHGLFPGIKPNPGIRFYIPGPQMGFSVPSIVLEGSIQAGGINISGMSVPGIPGMIIGRTPHHAWSMQVGHSHTTDYYLESPDSVFFHRYETIKVAGNPM